MNFPRTTTLLLSLLVTACVTPSASVTDLTRKNVANATALRDAQEASLESMNRFIASVEYSQLAYLKEARTKIELLTQQALRSKLEALGAEYRSRFDDALWSLRGDEFADMVQRDFRGPFNAALSKDNLAVRELGNRAREFPGDVPLQEEYKSAVEATQVARLRVDEKERVLETRASNVTSSARKRYAAKLAESLAHYRLLLDGVNAQGNHSYASILSAVKVERVEPRPISFHKHRAALEAWREESLSRLDSHIVALETADRYLRGKKLSFLFVEGSEALTPLTLPKVPFVSSLGLGDALIELRARETAIEGLTASLEELLTSELREVRQSLEGTVRLTRDQLANEMPFLQMPR